MFIDMLVITTDAAGTQTSSCFIAIPNKAKINDVKRKQKRR
ncbi:MAG: hypothetical protein ACOCX7_00470 [Bacteroidota bacterium]